MRFMWRRPGQHFQPLFRRWGRTEARWDFLVCRSGRLTRRAIACGALGTVTLAAAAIAQPEVGIRQGSRLNNLVIEVTEYIGDCPETVFARPEVTFIAPEEPVEDRRVRIYNRSVVGDEAAYTDREYEDGGDNPYLNTYGSESFRLMRSNQHTDRGLALVPGENDLIAIVYDGGRRNFLEPEEGYEEVSVYEFTATLETAVTQRTRDRVTTAPQVECEDGSSLANCAEEDRVNVQYSYCQGEPRSAWDRQIVGYSDARPGSRYLLRQEGRLRSGDPQRDGRYVHEYTFQGRSGQWVQINLDSNQFDPMLVLLDDSGRIVAENDDNNGTYNSEIFTQLRRSGRYRVRVTSYSDRATGSYRLTVQEDSSYRR